MRVNPDLADAHLRLGLAYWQQRRLDEAIRELQAALRINSNYAEAHFYMGLVHAIQGRLVEARREGRLALQLGYEPAREFIESLG